jgi:hypothetical protein
LKSFVGRICSTHKEDEEENAYKVFVGKLEGKWQLGRLRLRWEDNIAMDLREVGSGNGLDSSGS